MKVISIIGRPNVGKSTIFNRLNQSQHKAITHDMSGVTRDRHYSIVNFNEGDDEVKNEAIVVDTGGFFPNKLSENDEKEKVVIENKYFNIMASHARAAIDESDLVMLVVDAREGLQPFDQSIMNFIRQTNKRCWVIVNKLDSQRQQGLETDFYSLGVENEDLFPISAAHGNGFYELRMRIISFLEEPAEIDHDLKGIVPQGEVYARLALIGAPNVGKSTLLNALLETNRALVSDEAGTTRDPIEGYFNINFAKEFAAEKIVDENSLKTIQIVDTAGIRKMNKVDEHLESQSVYRSLRAIAESDVVIIVIDANKGIGHHEKRLCDIATDKGKSLVICINKYDLVKGNLPSSSEKKLWLEDLLYKAHWLSYCEVITISALKGMGIEQLKQSIKKTIISRLRKIPTPALNRVLTELVERNSIIPSSKMRVAFKIKYATQVKNNPPTFLIFGNRSKELPEHYRRYLKNGLREAYDFVGSPIHLLIKNANEMKEEGRNKGASPTRKVIEGKRTLPRREKVVEKRTPRRGRERVGVEERV